MATQLTPQPNLPSWTLPGNGQAQQPQASTPFNMAAILQAFAQMQQVQGQQRLQGQQQQLQAMDPLGETARSNSRNGGLSSQSSWESMFPSRPTGTGYPGSVSYAPPQMNFADAAVAASPQHTTPQANHLNFPPPLSGPMGNAQTDSAELAQNHAFNANPSAFMYPPKAPFVAQPQAQSMQPMNTRNKRAYKPTMF